MAKNHTLRRQRAGKQHNANRLHLRHHRHSGRLLPHHQTSYGALAFLLVLFSLLLASFTIISSVGATTQTSSGSVSLSGLVKGPPPATPATITSPSNNQTFGTNLITVSGTCGSGLVVKIWRNNVLAGSQVCTVDGTFSLTVQLVDGSNILRARNFDFADQPGPDSPDVTVYWVIHGQVKAGGSVNGVTGGASVAGDFFLTTEKAYYVTAVAHQIVWAFTISGGQTPYALLVDWGDGQQELKSLTKAGTFDLSHIYNRIGQYKIILKATDAAGRTGYLQTSAIIVKSGVFGLATHILPNNDQADLYYICWMTLAVAAAALFMFWLGERFGLRRKSFATVARSSRR